MLKITHALLESAKPCADKSRHSRESEHDHICYSHKKNNEMMKIYRIYLQI